MTKASATATAALDIAPAAVLRDTAVGVCAGACAGTCAGTYAGTYAGTCAGACAGTCSKHS